MGQTAKFDYYYGTQADTYSFYRIPKVLFTCAYFKELSCEAKVLYGLMLDRMSLSLKNRWFDDEGRVYIIFSLDDVMEHLGCQRQKAVKLIKELDQEKGIGLIEKKRIGFGKANTIYVKNFIIHEEPEQPQEIHENAADSGTACEIPGSDTYYSAFYIAPFSQLFVTLKKASTAKNLTCFASDSLPVEAFCVIIPNYCN